MEEFSVLLVDDEEDFLRTIIKRLSKRGIRAQGASRGEQALSMLAEEARDVVVLDVKMPGMDGIEVLQEIKRRSPATEVIVITGHGDMDLAIQALNLDAADFINKPIQRQSLEQGLTRARERLKLAKSRQNEVRTRSQGRALVVDIQGSVSSHSEPYLRDAYAKARQAGAARMVLHFDPSTSVNGAGIAILTQLVLESEKHGIEIVMAGLSENFRKVFGIVGLSRMVQIFDTLDQACA